MSSELCIMCKQSVDDRNRFGEKITFEDVTAHYFCLLWSSNLQQNGDDDEGIFGFMPADIKKEAIRARRHRCAYCRESEANISCCNKMCRRAFHFTCGSESDCHFEFVDPFKSFCDKHINIETPTNCHQSSELCVICQEEMGDYNPIQSIPSPCCKKNWFHKMCLQNYAFSAGYFTKCPCCKNSDQFRSHIAQLGIFIPDRDAEWEETGPTTFYDFERHNERPNECAAENCKMNANDSNQRQYKNNELVFCEYCGSKAIHECCLRKRTIFICDDCESKTKSKRRKIDHQLNDIKSNNKNDLNNNIANNVTVQNNEPQISAISLSEWISIEKTDFKPIKLKLKLPNRKTTSTNKTNSISNEVNKMTGKRKRNVT